MVDIPEIKPEEARLRFIADVLDFTNTLHTAKQNKNNYNS